MKGIIIFKNSNPEAFSELEGIVTKYKTINTELENTSVEIDNVGLFKCTDKGHQYLQFIKERSHSKIDKKCPICSIEKNHLNLHIETQSIKKEAKFNQILSKFICTNCKTTWYNYKNDIHYEIWNHNLICEERKKDIISLDITHPELIEEYSEENKYPINLISYEGWRDSSDKFKWICSRCNNIYHLTLHEKVTKKYYSCPYCNNILPLPEESLKITYPEIAEEWDRRNRHIPIASKEIYAPLISKNYASKRYNTRLLGFFKCSKCGIIYRRKIQDVIDKIDCEYCNAGATKTNTIKVFNEAGIYDENDFILYLAKQYHNFKCSICNHTYNANILDCLLEQYSCPKCDNKVINEKTNSLKALYPKLMIEWDYQNNNFLPEFEFPNSKREANWKCLHGHSYNMRIKRRIGYLNRSKTSCPYCDNRSLLPEFNSFKAKFPLLAEEWNLDLNKIMPEEIIYNCSVQIQWQCKNNHTYSMKTDKRVSYDKNKKIACPYCDNRKVYPGFNSFKVLHKDLLEEWNFESNSIDPDTIFPWSTEKIGWTCSLGHSYDMYVYERVLYAKRNRTACPYCDNRKVYPGFNSFKVLHKDLLEEWNFESNSIDPDTIFPWSTEKVEWMCSLGHSYDMSIKERVSYDKNKKIACPYCDNRKVYPGFNSFKVLHKDLLEEWDFKSNYLIVNPDSILDTNSFHKIYWKCKNEHLYKMTVKDRCHYQKRGIVACHLCKGLRQPRIFFLGP